MKILNCPKSLFAAAGLLISLNASSQIFYNNGATVYSAPGAIVQINGGAENANSGQLTNHGDMYITSNGAFPGSLTLSSLSVATGDGRFYIDRDFINNATFNQALSEVLMNSTSTNQLVTGSVVTTFHQLTLVSNGTPGSPLVTMTLDANIDSMLNLTDREMQTATFKLSVLNPDPTCVTNTTTWGSEGFVSSIAPGTLSRLTNATALYVFPVGSALGTRRYRPIDITPSANTNAEFTVRMVNNDATTDGFNRATNDGVMCFANPLFYHAINRPVSAVSADIRMNYDAAGDGNWTNMSHWRTTNNMWNDMNTIGPGANGGFATLTRNTWLFANPGDPYIMTVMRPAAPSIVCPGPLCSNNTNTAFSANSSDPNVTGYNWTNPSGSTLNSGQGTSNVNVDWGTATGYILVYAVNAQGCQSSLADSCTVTINQAPTAAFTSNVSPANQLTYNFTDVTNPVITNWSWNFGDGGTSGNQNPSYAYSGPGTYNVQLIITNAAGCMDTVLATVIVDYDENVVIPNIFSPNGDGINDSFFITHSGFKTFHIDIFNRWGQKLYSSDAANFAWDGKDTNGQYVSDGTYYFILKGTSLGGKEYDEHGSVYAFVK